MCSSPRAAPTRVTAGDSVFLGFQALAFDFDYTYLLLWKISYVKRGSEPDRNILPPCPKKTSDRSKQSVP